MQFESGYPFSCTSGETRGPSPRSYVPSMGIQAFTRLRLSNMNWRSTARSRTRGNLVIGSGRIRYSHLCIGRAALIRALPVIGEAAEPPVSPGQLEAEGVGVGF